MVNLKNGFMELEMMKDLQWRILRSVPTPKKNKELELMQGDSQKLGICYFLVKNKFDIWEYPQQWIS